MKGCFVSKRHKKDLVFNITLITMKIGYNIYKNYIIILTLIKHRTPKECGNTFLKVPTLTLAFPPLVTFNKQIYKKRSLDFKL